MLSDLLSMRLPRFRYDRISWVLFLLITALILLSAVTRKKNSFASETSVAIIPLESGEKMLGDRDVRQNLLQAFGNTLEGTELAELEIERIERVLESDPFVDDAEVYVGQSNALHVRIRQREPILRIMDNTGGNYFLDINGAKIPTSALYTPRVLVATGNVAPYTGDFQEKRRNTLKDVFALTQYIMNDEVWSIFIQQIHVNNANEIILIPLVGDQKIILGSVKNMEDKLNRLKIFYEQGMPYSGWRIYKTISLKYNGQVVCKK
jgi:cell division protein FtsQ